MPISDAEKKVLLQRLELARVAKQKKAAEAKAAKETKSAPAPAPAPAPEPTPEPELAPASDPIDIPAVPDLVAASRKHAKKVCLPVESDSEDEEIVLPKKKKATTAKKDTPYLKIKLYKEPQDKLAFQNLLQAVAGEAEEEDDDDESAPPPPPQKHYSKGPQVIHRVGATPRGAVVKNITKEDMEAADLRRLALQIFG
jgi:hypothetical protein